MTPDYVFFLGSHSTLSAAECFGTLSRAGFAPTVKAAHERFLILGLKKELPEAYIDRLGGVSRIGVVRAEGTQLWSAGELAALLSPTPTQLPKLTFGLSAIGAVEAPLKKLGLDIKKQLKETGVKANFVTPAKGQQLNSAQVLFNRLHQTPNKEVTFLKNGDRYYAVETRQVQDIQAYERRDTGRPARDAYVGMLPPKLAQIMLNLVPSFPASPPVILDPFCGTGVVLQEGWLLTYAMIGSDAKATMVTASEQNMRWVQQQTSTTHSTSPPVLFQHDIRLPYKRIAPDTIDAIVTEPYLGEPLSSPLPAPAAVTREQELADLYLSFFRNAQPVLKNGAFVLFILPSLREGQNWRLFPPSFLDEVSRLGYDSVHLVPNELQQFYQASERGTIIYARPDALVGRELTLWHIRKPEAQHN
jgi:tRNA G10  N-methylase Trm11